MDLCPDNATACLLRAIIDGQKDSGPNWDVGNFVVALGIGILAFGAAVATIFQGALSAGTGRLKASQRAIGKYSEYTKTYLSWSERRYRTTTRVPYISIPSLAVGQLSPGSRRWVNAISNKTTSIKARNTHEKSQGYAAGWTNLLTELPGSFEFFQQAEAIHLSSSTENAVPLSNESLGEALLAIDTEYVPGDIPAVPATGTVESIVTLAALIGCDEVTMVDNYPIARSENMQLSFRDHPLLGIVAVFQTFPRIPSYRNRLDLATLLKNCDLYAPGVAHFRSLLGPKHQWYDAPTIQRLLFASPLWPRAVPYARFKFSETAKLLCSMSKPWTTLDAWFIVSAFQHEASSRRMKLFWDIPQRETYGIRAPIQYLSDRRFGAAEDPELGADWAVYEHRPYYAWIIGQNIDKEKMVHANLGDRRFVELEISAQSVRDQLQGLPPPPSSSLTTDQIGTECMILVAQALDICIDFLQDKFDLSESTFGGKANARGSLRYQLHEIDCWLSNAGLSDDDLRRAYVDLTNYETPGTSLPLNVSYDQAKNSPVWQFPKIPIGPEEDPSPAGNEGLLAILAYRAVVMAAFLSTAADISCVSGTEFGKRVVSFL